MKQSTLRNARGGTGLEDVPFALTPEEELQAKLDIANQLEALTDLPTIQGRGRAMQAEVKQTVADLIALEYGVYDLMGDEYLDYQRSIHDGVSSAFWFDAVKPESF